MRPSIIFFDEIDGLAPVRSSRQDQIHSSIVSTLLGLMDGLDNRGEIIVIGKSLVFSLLGTLWLSVMSPFEGQYIPVHSNQHVPVNSAYSSAKCSENVLALEHIYWSCNLLTSVFGWNTSIIIYQLTC